MSEENYAFPPYEEKMKEALQPFAPKRLDFYQGKDIRVFQQLKGKNMESSKYLYEAPKLEKISFAVHNSPDWFRALVSPYCLTSDFAPTTQKTQKAIMELTLGYLAIYIDLWKRDEPYDPDYMKPLIKRRNAIKAVFRQNDPGAKMMEVAVGNELAEFSMNISF